MTHPNELTRQAQAARDLLAAYKDIIGEDEDFAMDVVEGQTDLIEVVNSLIAQEIQDEAHIKAITATVKTFAARKARIKTRIDRRRELLVKAFQTAEIKGAMRCALGTVGLNPTPWRALPTDEKKIPAEFWKHPAPTLDLIALRAALAKGPVAGAAKSNGGVAISIRTN